MDKATFILHYNQVPNSDFLQEIPEYITDFEEHRNSRGIYITGKIGNLFVTANEFYITVGRASLCKYYYSNNIENMSIIDVKNAIVKLSDELHLPIDIATVCKFEYGITLITDYSPQDYFPLLGNMPFRSRLEQDYGLYYKEKSNNTQYVCYDKLAECKRNKEIIPMKFNDVQLLRLEIRYNKNLAKHFNCERVLVSQLYDPLFFNSVHDEWFKYYNAIQKIQRLNCNLEDICTVSQYAERAIHYFIEAQGGSQQAIKNLELLDRRNKINAKQKHDLKNKIMKVGNSEFLTTATDEILELNKRVTDSYISGRAIII